MQVWRRSANCQWVAASCSADGSLILNLVGKSLRDGQGQATNKKDSETLDLVITNALIVDWSGIYKVLSFFSHCLTLQTDSLLL